MKSKIKILYEYFYQQATSNQNWEFRPRENEETMIDKFVSWLSISHGDEWLFQYFCYQFSRYIDLQTRFGKGKIMLGWVIGKKAFEKYKSATDEEKYWGEEFKTRFKLKNPLNKTLSSISSKSYKDRERMRYYGENIGFIHCSDLKLFSESSRICKVCKYKTYCK